jgi:L-lactate utilization protein LutB
MDECRESVKKYMEMLSAGNWMIKENSHDGVYCFVAQQILSTVMNVAGVNTYIDKRGYVCPVESEGY